MSEILTAMGLTAGLAVLIELFLSIAPVICLIIIARQLKKVKSEAESTTDNTGAINEQLHDLKDSLRRIEKQLKQQKEDPRG